MVLQPETGHDGATLNARTIDNWRRAWDAMMSTYLPDSEAALSAVFDTIQPRTPAARPHVLDLGGGPGTVTDRVLCRWPGAAVTLLDMDPVLPALARAALPPAVAVVDADLATPGWNGFRTGQFDAVLAVMTVHYLPSTRIQALYREVRSALRPGGALFVIDAMPEPEPSGARGAGPREGPHAPSTWDDWWAEVRAHPQMATLLTRRDGVFGHRAVAEFTASAAWHRSALRTAGFTETTVPWRHGTHAAVAAWAG
ncbi:class I SAM-dependent methyltransferase [Actinomycetes bacterium KLBMP 9797]